MHNNQLITESLDDDTIRLIKAGNLPLTKQQQIMALLHNDLFYYGPMALAPARINLLIKISR